MSIIIYEFTQAPDPPSGMAMAPVPVLQGQQLLAAHGLALLMCRGLGVPGGLQLRQHGAVLATGHRGKPRVEPVHQGNPSGDGYWDLRL